MSENMEHARWLIIDTYTMHIKLGLNPILGLGISERSMCIWNSSYFHKWQLFFEFFSFFQQLHARLSYSTLCISFAQFSHCLDGWQCVNEHERVSVIYCALFAAAALMSLLLLLLFFFHICCASIPSRTLFLLHA